MDQAALRAQFMAFRPTHVVHLAARTDTDEKRDVEAYRQNHEGTRLLLEVVKEDPGIEHIVVTSTQFVCEAGYQPKDDLDFKPFTIYGESKRLTELVTREAGLNCRWTIIRPTTIWGPWSLRYRDVMFRIMTKGLYFHPSRARVIRSYGYVGNVVWQIGRILELGAPAHGKALYVGDQPFDLKIWVDAVSRELTGKPVRFIPAWMIKGMALAGDALKVVGIPFPITSGRFRSMTSDYVTPMDRTIQLLGAAPFSMGEGVKEFVKWYREESSAAVSPTLKEVRPIPASR
jgi:nucleoside-diphosphate-sugar epimerase